jgi:hypothetical protein
MAIVATDQQLIRQLQELMKTMGLRHAVHNAATYNGELVSDSYAIYTHLTGASALAAPAAGTQRLVLDFRTSELTTMDEKAVGAIHPHVPSPTRQ